MKVLALNSSPRCGWHRKTEQMLMERKYRAEGDISLMTRLFRRN